MRRAAWDGRAIASCVGTWVVLWLATAVFIAPHNLTPGPGPWRAFSYFDFRDTVWFPVQEFWSGGVPWATPVFLARHPGIQDFVLYLPWYFYPALVLQAVPYPVAIVMWIGVSTASLVFLAWVSITFAVPTLLRRWPWLVPALAVVLVLMRSERSALFQGQWAIICSAAAVFLIVRPRQDRWGVVAALLTLVKPPVGLPVILCLFVQRRWRTLCLSVAIAAVLVTPIAITVLVRLGGVGGGVNLLRASLGAGYLTALGGVVTRVDVLGTFSASGVPLGLAGSIVILGVSTIILLGGLWISGGYQDDDSLLAVTFGCLAVLILAPNLLYGAPVTLPAIIGHAKLAIDKVRQRAVARGLTSAVIALCMAMPQLIPGRLYGKVGLSDGQSVAFGGWCFIAAMLLTACLLVLDRLGRRSAPDVS